ncbi:MAG: RNA-binding protein [Sulfurovum sp. AS07-7]|jgi:predicted RNA-binding protein YlqC (UPF0109 family)|nr:MAG: RNA-binding protein [Sulfurovum sp. AS07-7]KIM03423.1 MAG: RNA-binding protein [Sulfurovum sp. FS06-10]MBD3794654.1 KH domain-containing protein [Campylobacterota bacterium]MBD3839717.1 KH domain-containing protein [Campylobacterota bacterium]TQV63488.1 MAG: KH domain-containing protein [Sulfurovum sp.]
MITEFVTEFTKLLVEYPDKVKVTTELMSDDFCEVSIYAHSSDVGKLIGKEGRMINAIKTVITGCKAKGAKNYRVNVKTAE